MYKRKDSRNSNDTTVSRVDGRIVINYGVEERTNLTLGVILRGRRLPLRDIVERMQRLHPSYTVEDVKTAIKKLREENLVVLENGLYSAVVGARARWDALEKVYVGENAEDDDQEPESRRAG